MTDPREVKDQVTHGFIRMGTIRHMLGGTEAEKVLKQLADHERCHAKALQKIYPRRLI